MATKHASALGASTRVLEAETSVSVTLGPSDELSGGRVLSADTCIGSKSAGVVGCINPPTFPGSTGAPLLGSHAVPCERVPTHLRGGMRNSVARPSLRRMAKFYGNSAAVGYSRRIIKNTQKE